VRRSKLMIGSYHTSSGPSRTPNSGRPTGVVEGRNRSGGPDAGMLPGEYRQSHEAGIHMNAKGLQVHCRRWANRVEA
jgi:hypothetical protein